MIRVLLLSALLLVSCRVTTVSSGINESSDNYESSSSSEPSSSVDEQADRIAVENYLTSNIFTEYEYNDDKGWSYLYLNEQGDFEEFFITTEAQFGTEVIFHISGYWSYNGQVLDSDGLSYPTFLVEYTDYAPIENVANWYVGASDLYQSISNVAAPAVDTMLLSYDYVNQELLAVGGMRENPNAETPRTFSTQGILTIHNFDFSFFE